jgi:two-component system, LuxR family, sensor kinase FixL
VRRRAERTFRVRDAMNWVQIAWVMMIAASLMLGVVHLFVWQRERAQYAHLLFFGLAASAAAYGAYELARMQAEMPASFAANARWSHVPLAAFVVAVVGFVRLYFNAGRLWLAYTVVGLRLAALALNFLTGVNVNFREIPALDHLQLWGGAVVSGPIGIPNPWAIVPQLSNLLLVVFIADASITLWRRGGQVSRRRATFVGGSLAFCIIAAASFAALVVTGVVHAPTILMPGFFVVVLAMGYELVWDLVAAGQLAAQLRASEQRFRAVVEAVPSAILLVNDKGVITLANARAETIFGYKRAELVTRSVEMLIPERFRLPHAALRSAYAADPQARAMGAGRELSARRKDGREIPVEAALSPMPTKDGVYVLVSVVDISERRKVELETARQRDDLAHLSRVAMLGELSGSLAHELNQPLTAILSNAQAAQRFLAQSPPRVDKLAEILADIVKSDHRAGAVIQRLRSMLRKEETQRLPLDLNDVVEESLRLMRSDLLSRQVEVGTELAATLPAVNGDRNQLQQVLLNLVINGCDAMDGQAAERRLRVRTQTTVKGNVEICVVDRGAGIPAANLEQIFEPFVTTKATGMGLGLAICRSIIEAHGGRLWATNNPDCGATLHCELPSWNS